jgi:hypothetical protein
VTALAHKVTWQAPRPLWRGATRFAARPQLLRFASDDFMERLLAILAEEPARLSDRIARPETWRDPPQPADLQDPVVRVPLPAPMKSAKRRRLRGTAPTPPPLPAVQPLKLYQPAQQRYYIVAATLACQVPGLPERAVEGGHETVGFVVRRLLPASGRTDADAPLVEYAYVLQEAEPCWQRVADGADLAPGEEQLPLFPMQHRDEDGRLRTLWGGLVPVARREEYLGRKVVTTPVSLAAGQMAALRPAAAAPRPNSRVARTAQLRTEFAEPWKALVRAAIGAGGEFEIKAPGADESVEERTGRVRDYNAQFQHQSWLLLLDLRKWIDANLPGVKAALAGQPAELTGPESEVWSFLATANASGLQASMPGKTMAANMRDALRDILAFEDKLEAATIQYAPEMAASTDWPSFHFPLAGLRLPATQIAAAEADGPYKAVLPPAPQYPPVGDVLDPPGASGDEALVIDPIDVPAGSRDVEELDRFTALLARALPPSDEAGAQPIPHAMKLRDVMLKTAGDPGLFVVRMVHMNADCGPLHPPTLSAGTERFHLASFFDPDAPVRPVTITLPSDTTPAGLRKHGRGTAFVMSDLLCGQVQRAKGLGFVDLVLQVLPWPFHKSIKKKVGGKTGGCKSGSGVEMGMICSLSIPIITLCAMILLICIVMLLDFIFRWVPWLMTCFPLPGFKGKRRR